MVGTVATPLTPIQSVEDKPELEFLRSIEEDSFAREPDWLSECDPSFSVSRRLQYYETNFPLLSLLYKKVRVLRALLLRCRMLFFFPSLSVVTQFPSEIQFI